MQGKTREREHWIPKRRAILLMKNMRQGWRLACCQQDTCDDVAVMVPDIASAYKQPYESGGSVSSPEEVKIFENIEAIRLQKQVSNLKIILEVIDVNNGCTNTG